MYLSEDKYYKSGRKPLVLGLTRQMTIYNEDIIIKQFVIVIKGIRNNEVEDSVVIDLKEVSKNILN